MTRLVTDRLILRAAQDTDLGPLFAIYGDADAMKYWSSLPHKTIAETAKRLKHLKAPGPRLYFVVEYQSIAIGTAGIHEDDEIGFILHPAHWRRGLMQEAVAAIIAHTWATTGLTQITADADPDNAASVGFLTALGFQVTGSTKNTYRIDGHWSDSVCFALVRPA